MSELFKLNWRTLNKWIMVLFALLLPLYDFIIHIEEPNILRMSLLPFIFLLTLRILFFIFRFKKEKALFYTPFLSMFILLLGAPNTTYIIFSLLYLFFKPLKVPIIKNISTCFSINNQKYIHFTLLISSVISIALYTTDFSGEKANFLKFISRVLPAYFIYLIIFLMIFYLQHKIKENNHTIKKILSFSSTDQISWDLLRSWFINNIITFVCIMIAFPIIMSSLPYIVKMIASIFLGMVIGIPFPIAILFFVFPNLVYSVLAILLIFLFLKNIKDYLTLENLINNNLRQLFVFVFFSFTIDSTQTREWAIKIVSLVGPWYLFCLILIVTLSYYKSKKEEDIKTEREINALFKLFEKHDIKETTYPIICESCGAESLLELGEGKSCDYCNAWLSRKEN